MDLGLEESIMPIDLKVTLEQPSLFPKRIYAQNHRSSFGFWSLPYRVSWQPLKNADSSDMGVEVSNEHSGIKAKVATK